MNTRMTIFCVLLAVYVGIIILVERASSRLRAVNLAMVYHFVKGFNRYLKGRLEGDLRKAKSYVPEMV